MPNECPCIDTCVVGAAVFTQPRPLTVNNTVAASTVSATNLSSQGFKVTNGSLNCINFEFHSVPIDAPSADGWFGPYAQDAIVTISLSSNSLDRLNEIQIGGNCSSSYYINIDNFGSGMIQAPLLALRENLSGVWSIVAAPMTFFLKGGSTFNLNHNWQWGASFPLVDCLFELRVNKFGGAAA